LGNSVVNSHTQKEFRQKLHAAFFVYSIPLLLIFLNIRFSFRVVGLSVEAQRGL
jgi:hypothetical protein